MTPQTFRQTRDRLGITQKKMAQILDVSIRNVQQFEQVEGSNARKPNPTACKVLEYIEKGILDINRIPLTEKEEAYKKRVLEYMEREIEKMRRRRNKRFAARPHVKE